MSSTYDIDRIVREVVRRLQKQNGHPAVVGAGTEQRRTVPGDVLRLTNRVVAMAQVADRLNGVRQLVVPRRAVVTPAVRDELRARQVVLVRDDGQTAPVGTDGERHGLVVASDESSYVWSGLSCEFEVHRVAASDLETQLEQMEVSMNSMHENPTIGLFVSRHPYVVACTANRRPAFRAAAVADAAEAAEARDTLDANLFVVRPLPRYRVNEILQTARQWR